MLEVVPASCNAHCCDSDSDIDCVGTLSPLGAYHVQLSARIAYLSSLGKEKAFQSEKQDPVSARQLSQPRVIPLWSSSFDQEVV